MLDIPGMAYFNKNTWCGSKGNHRCRISVAEDSFIVTMWDGPYSFEVTEDEKKTTKSFEHTLDGLDKVKNFLSQML